MKQKTTLLFTALLLFGFAQAQVSKESYDKAVDLLNCKTIELSLQDDKSFHDYQAMCPCEEAGYSQINQFLTKEGKLNATIALSKEVDNLKKSYKENWKKDDVVTFLSETIFTNNIKYAKIYAFADKRKGKHEFDTYKANLKTDLFNKLEVNSEPTKPSTETDNDDTQQTIEDRITELENKITELEKNKNISEGSGFLGGLNEYLILFAILLGVIALLLGLKKKNTETNYDTLVNKLISSQRMNSHFQSQSVIRSTPNSNVSSSELKDANNRIRDLESQIEKIKEQLNTSNSVQSFITQPTYQETKQPEELTHTFFLSTPNADGSFNESSASSTYRDGASIYRFTKIGNNKAKFQIEEKEASTKLALQYPDKSIDPVCDALNAFNPKAALIRTVEPGEAELQNGKWVVERNKKAKIKYEN